MSSPLSQSQLAVRGDLNLGPDAIAFPVSWAGQTYDIPSDWHAWWGREDKATGGILQSRAKHTDTSNIHSEEWRWRGRVWILGIPISDSTAGHGQGESTESVRQAKQWAVEQQVLVKEGDSREDGQGGTAQGTRQWAVLTPRTKYPRRKAKL